MRRRSAGIGVEGVDGAGFSPQFQQVTGEASVEKGPKMLLLPCEKREKLPFLRGGKKQFWNPIFFAVYWREPTRREDENHGSVSLATPTCTCAGLCFQSGCPSSPPPPSSSSCAPLALRFFLRALDSQESSRNTLVNSLIPPRQRRGGKLGEFAFLTGKTLPGAAPRLLQMSFRRRRNIHLANSLNNYMG